MPRSYAKSGANSSYQLKGCKRGLNAKKCGEQARDCWYQKPACEEKTNITFFRDKKGRRLSGALPGDLEVFLRTNIFVAGWPWIIAAVASSLFWVYLNEEGIATFPVDGAAIGVALGIFAFWANTVWSGTSGKRDGAGGNFVGMVSGTKNLMHALVSSLNVKKARANPMVEVSMHNGASYEEVSIPAMALFKLTAVTLNAIIAAQRNALRGGLDPTLLPLYPSLASEVITESANGIDVIEVLQTMALRYIAALNRSGIVDLDDEWTQGFYKDKVDSLGNIDVGGKLPFSRANANYAFLSQVIVTVVLPLQFSRIFPGYSTVWIAPLTLAFYYGLFGIAQRQAKIAVTNADNVWTDIALTEEMYSGAESNYASAAQAARIVAGKDALKINDGVEPKLDLVAPAAPTAPASANSVSVDVGGWEDF